jgi:hypothetical protein
MIGGKVMNFIEELYYGNINPNEKRYDKDTHYAKTMRKFCDSENELGKMLKGKPLHLVNDLTLTRASSIQSEPLSPAIRTKEKTF